MNHTIEDLDRIVRKVYDVKIASIALLLSIFALGVWTNISYAQLFQPGAAQDLLLPHSPDKQVLPLQLIKNAIKITSPTKHQLVPIGKNLIITGTTRYQGLLDNPLPSIHYCKWYKAISYSYCNWPWPWWCSRLFKMGIYT